MTEHTENPAVSKMKGAINHFTASLSGVHVTKDLALPIISSVRGRAAKALTRYLKLNNIEEINDTYNIPIEKYARFKRHVKRVAAFQVALVQLPRSLVVSIVSSYDVFLGDILRAAFYLKPEMLNGTERILTFKELVEFGNIDDARAYIIEKEIESVIRSSHIQQFEWMENKFVMPLRSGLDSWKHFVEATQRRNLFVHCDGIVSAQYIELCAKHGVEVGETSVGDMLHVDEAYLQAVWECVYEVGVKLAHVIWRKLSPSSLAESEKHLIDNAIELLEEKQYSLLAKILPFFVFDVKKHSSEANRRILLVNYCISLKFSGNSEEMEKVLAREDFTACDARFHLAEAVLNDHFEKAAKIMIEIGANNPKIPRHAYESWPLFREFRKSSEFGLAFKTLFGEDFKIEKAAGIVAAVDAVDATAQHVVEPAESGEEIEPEATATDTETSTPDE